MRKGLDNIKKRFFFFNSNNSGASFHSKGCSKTVELAMTQHLILFFQGNTQIRDSFPPWCKSVLSKTVREIVVCNFWWGNNTSVTGAELFGNWKVLCFLKYKHHKFRWKIRLKIHLYGEDRLHYYNLFFLFLYVCFIFKLLQQGLETKFSLHLVAL